MAAVLGLGVGVAGGFRIGGGVVVASQIHAVNINSNAGGIKRLPQCCRQRVRFSNGRLSSLMTSRYPRVVQSVDVDDSATEAEEPSIKTPAQGEVEPETPSPPRGLEERFAVKDLGKHECRSCGYIYDISKGDSNYPVPAGIEFGGLPEDWRCPTCGAAKTFFVSKSIEIAGFAQNQQFGLGGNSLTEGQKSLLIYGALAFFFSLFLAGYLLQ